MYVWFENSKELQKVVAPLKTPKYKIQIATI